MKLVAALLLPLVLVGCATTRITTAPAVRDAILLSASGMVDEPGRMLVVEVGSSGAVADATFIRMSQTVGPSKMAEQVAALLARSEGRKASLLLFGPNSSKTRQVAADALVLSEDKDLSRITLLFSGEESDVVRLKKDVPAFRGTVLYVPQQRSPNPTPDGMRRPADGPPKPSA